MAKPVLNKRRLGALARWLEAGAPPKEGVVGFNMDWFAAPRRWGDDVCGTTCCIAGAAVAFYGTEKQKSLLRRGLGGNIPFITVGRRLLGLTETMALKLFYGGADDKSEEKKIAAKVLRNLIKTGRVNWPSI